MILRSKRNIEREGISANKLYPVIEYEKNIQSGAERYKIYDDCRSVSWKTLRNFSVESDILDNYTKKRNDDTDSYSYIGIDEDFYTQLYLENEKSGCVREELEKKLIDILSSELSVENIIDNIYELGLKNEGIDMLLFAFFKKATKQDIINLSIYLYERITEMNSYILEIIVNNMKLYKESDVENLFVEIYMNASCTEDVLNLINNYLD
ncbi:MAG: hypothetical protein HDT39_13625 [Lachnospiraceae bacterium]|nr:hypothetical protein [Lachnospiraceae bacterium]